MPTAHVNGITLNYLLEGPEDAETIVLINGLADALESWDFQVPAFLEAGYRVLRFDNRGIGASDKPVGPYTSRMLADDAKALVDELGITGFHLMGVSMGGMIAEEYAINYGTDLVSATFACTYGTPDAFCLQMFGFWADLATVVDVPFVMRDVSLWAFTGPFFEERPEDAAEFAEGMAALDMTLEAYLSQLHVIQTHDAMDRLSAITVPTFVLAGEEDILIPVRLSRRLHEALPGSAWGTVPGGHACLWESPDPFNAAFLDFVRTSSR
ncbi:alpha/beta fold hydrolase [Naasia lichenicola]|uniref:Alpha/beta fold hydrolase n=1 Tax=Naasia lichenicola TaxID=2565933 RepID=A0A4S4FJP7_9MICO|nr:alpha/beta hydrolase [Naasia lichenicola]THG30643.1 alpha/beta fold hydrolase [Naasia lichenicola]THG31880.1 alpha/beta fold hydrolase [Naasia lichenicola]